MGEANHSSTISALAFGREDRQIKRNFQSATAEKCAEKHGDLAPAPIIPQEAPLSAPFIGNAERKLTRPTECTLSNGRKGRARAEVEDASREWRADEVRRPPSTAEERSRVITPCAATPGGVSLARSRLIVNATRSVVRELSRARYF